MRSTKLSSNDEKEREREREKERERKRERERERGRQYTIHNTQTLQSRSIIVESIESRAIVGAVIQKNGFIFNYEDDKKKLNESSSDDGDSF